VTNEPPHVQKPRAAKKKAAETKEKQEDGGLGFRDLDTELSTSRR